VSPGLPELAITVGREGAAVSCVVGGASETVGSGIGRALRILSSVQYAAACAAVKV